MNLQHEGKFEMPSTAKSGTNKYGKPYTNWKHSIGGKIFGSFKTAEELGLKDQENYIVAYEESPNATHPESPYKNITNITPAVSKDEVKESNKQYNVKDVGKLTQEDSEEERWAGINHNKQTNILFGQVVNKTLEFILANKDLSVVEHFSQVFDKIWKEVMNKRKEKLK